jgi:tight adherence protein C
MDNLNLDYLIYVLIVVGIFTAYMAVLNIVKQQRTRKLLEAEGFQRDYLVQEESREPVMISFIEAFLALGGKSEARLRETTMLLSQAGLFSPHATTYYLFFQRFIQPLFLLAAAYFAYQLVAPGDPKTLSDKLKIIIMAALCAIIGLRGARIYITNIKQRRQKIILRSFPETLDLLLVCIESGLGLDAALTRVCNEMRDTHPIITSELDRTRAQLAVMSDRAQVLQALSDRMEIVQFKSLVSALIQTEKFGTSLVDTLRVISDDLRISRLMDAENRAARIPVLITIPLIFCVMPAFVMIILGPPFIQISQQGGIFGDRAAQVRDAGSGR